MAQALRGRAALLAGASRTLAAIGLYSVALAYAMAGRSLPRLASATPFLLAMVGAALARRARRRAEARERELDRRSSKVGDEEGGRDRRHPHLRLVWSRE